MGIFFFSFSTACLLLDAAAAAASSPPGCDGPSQNGNWSFIPTYGSRSLGHHVEMMTKMAFGPWVVAAATAAIPGSG